jgi:predicted nucleic acid-binding protein
MTEATRGVLDTSVVFDHDQIDAERLPDESAFTAVTFAELAAGPHATRTSLRLSESSEWSQFSRADHDN